MTFYEDDNSRDLVIKYPDLYATPELAHATCDIFSAVKGHTQYCALQGVSRDVALNPDNDIKEIEKSKSNALVSVSDFISIVSRWGSEVGMILTTPENVTPVIKEMMKSGATFCYKWGREDSQNAAVMLVIYAIDNDIDGWETITTNGTIAELVSALRIYELCINEISDETFSKVLTLFGKPAIMPVPDEDDEEMDPDEPDILASIAFAGYDEDALSKLTKSEFYSRISAATLSKLSQALTALIARELNFMNCNDAADEPVEDVLVALGGDSTSDIRPSETALGYTNMLRPLSLLEGIWKRSDFGAVTDDYDFHKDEYDCWSPKNRDNGVWERKNVRRAKTGREILDAIAKKREAYGYDEMYAALRDGVPEDDVFA